MESETPEANSGSYCCGTYYVGLMGVWVAGRPALVAVACCFSVYSFLDSGT